MTGGPTRGGGCLCGTVRYAAAGEPDHVVHCHCTLCRRATGAPFATWATYPVAAVTFAAQTPHAYRSSSWATRGFCPRCGTQITFQFDRKPEEIDITVASLDDPEPVIAQRHIWMEDRLSWIKLADGLPQLPRESHPDPD